MLIVCDGRVVEISQRAAPDCEDLGNVALIPGLVNTHSHLELSDCRSPLTPLLPFTTWIGRLLQHRRERPPQSEGTDLRTPWQQGAAEMLATGTTVVGDIVDAAWHPAALPGEGLLTIAFRELLTLSPGRIPELVSAAEAHLAASKVDVGVPAASGVEWRPGLSPHAPYSVHPQLLRKLVDLACQWHVPVAMHVAETRAELQLLAGQGGEFQEFLQRMGVWNPEPFRGDWQIPDILRELARVSRGLVVHGNFLQKEDQQLLAKSPQLSVVYCPRTHAQFGHPPHPWRDLLNQGINVALGTDSRASNPDLSLWEELRFLRQTFPEVPGELLLDLGTRRGARALGLETMLGEISPGWRADFAVVALPDRSDPADPHELLFAPASRIVKTWSGGHPAGV
jgi:cytosine/adenosine deaminase-related metal-dependent hydrolase